VLLIQNFHSNWNLQAEYKPCGSIFTTCLGGKQSRRLQAEWTGSWERIKAELAKPHLFSGHARDYFGRFRLFDLDNDFMRTIAIICVLTCCLIIYVFSGPLQIRDGRGRIVQGNAAAGSMQGAPMPTGPDAGRPIYHNITRENEREH